VSGWRWHDWEHSKRVRSNVVPINRRTCIYEGRSRSSKAGILWLCVLCMVWLLVGLAIGLWIS
jgi:hypothetical protein